MRKLSREAVFARPNLEIGQGRQGIRIADDDVEELRRAQVTERLVDVVVDPRQDRLHDVVETILACDDARLVTCQRPSEFGQLQRPSNDRRTDVKVLPPGADDIATPLAQAFELVVLPLARALLGDLVLDGSVSDTGDLRSEAAEEKEPL
jgi:hypothetical protein